MKFNISVFLIGFFAVTSLQAQKVDSTVVVYDNIEKQRVVTNFFGSNWFAGAGVGGQMYFGDHNRQMKFADRWTPAVDFTVGKWFTPGIAVRLGASGFKINGVSGWSGHSAANPNVGFGNYMGFIKNAVVDVNGKVISGDVYGREESGAYDLYKTQINYIQGRADVLFNISGMVNGWNPKRIYSFIPYAGLGWMSTFNYDVKNKRSNEVSAAIGLLNSFRLSDAVNFNFDVRGSYVNERFDGQTGRKWGEGLLSATVGLTYNFNKRGWDRPTTKVVTYRNDNTELLEKIKELEAANLHLKEQLATNTKGEMVIDKKLVAAPQLIVFPINVSKLGGAGRVNLGFLANVMKLMSNTAQKYIITGYADRSTGTDPINVRLSRERAQAVFNCLVNEFGVSPDRLQIEWEGGVSNMFYNDPRLSRAVIVRAVE